MAHGYNKEGFIQEKELWIFKFDEEYVLPLIRQQVQLSRVAIGKRVKVKNNTQCTPSRDTFVPHQKHTTPVGETTDNPMLVAVAAATDKEVKGKHNTQHVTPPTKLAPERISTFLLQNKPLRNKKKTQRGRQSWTNMILHLNMYRLWTLWKLQWWQQQGRS